MSLILQFVGDIENIRVVERHMMAIATKDNQVFLVDDAGVAISSSGTLTFDVEKLDILLVRVAEHWRAICIFHWTSHCLSLSHHLIVLIKVRLIVVFDEEGALKLGGSW